jgi:hypothetical protein
LDEVLDNITSKARKDTRQKRGEDTKTEDNDRKRHNTKRGRCKNNTTKGVDKEKTTSQSQRQ